MDLLTILTIVSGDVARSAANAIINSVNSRLMVALQHSADTAAHMSYSSNGNGIGMAANRLIGGLSLWSNYSSSDFDNDQILIEFLLILIIIRVTRVPYLLV